MITLLIISAIVLLLAVLGLLWWLLQPLYAIFRAIVWWLTGR